MPSGTATTALTKRSSSWGPAPRASASAGWLKRGLKAQTRACRVLGFWGFRGLGFRVLGLRVLGFRVLGFRVFGFRVFGFRVLGCRVCGVILYLEGGVGDRIPMVHSVPV